MTAQRAMRLGISLAERSLDYLLPATSPESPPRPRPTRPALPMSESGPPNSPPNGGPPAPRLRSPSPPTTRPSRRASVRTGSANQPTPRRSRSPPGVSPKSKASPLHGTTRRPTFPAPAASHALQPGMARPPLVPAPAPRFPLGQASRLRVGTASGTRNTVRFDCGTRNPVRSGPHTQPTRPLRIQRQTPPPRQRRGEVRQSAGSGSVAGGGAHAREPSRDSARVRTQVRAPLTLAPTVVLPAGLFIQGLPFSPSAPLLHTVHSFVASLSPSLAALESGLVLAPVVRRRAHTPAFFLSHLSFGDPALATRILQELAAGNAPDQKGRVRLASPCGTLKVALARAPSRPALQDVPPPRVPSPPPDPSAAHSRADPSPVSAGPDTCRTVPKTVAFTATHLDEGRECICCRQEFLEGERLQRLQCLHTMHSDCLERWLSAAHFGGRCPQCNEPVL